MILQALEREPMKLTDLLCRDCVLVPLKNAEKTGAITELVDRLRETGRIHDHDSVLKAVLAREARGSTCIGEGLAVPHAKSAAAPTLTMAVGKPDGTFDFDGGRPCSMIVLLVGPPETPGLHIQTLASVSRLWLSRDFRQEALCAQNPEELYDAFVRYQM